MVLRGLEVFRTMNSNAVCLPEHIFMIKSAGHYLYILRKNLKKEKSTKLIHIRI